MNLLLDTHVFLWWLTDDPRLSDDAKEIMRNPHHIVWFSAASSWEISIKRCKGKLKMTKSVKDLLNQERFSFLTIGLPETERIATLPDHHQDPFDRMLIAQALEYGLTLLTGDKKILRYAAPVLDCRRERR